MKHPMLLSFPICSSLLSVLAACSAEPVTGPPSLRLGRDECGECGMLINEDRCSSGLLIEDAGRRDYLLFDDVGCMLDTERRKLGERRVIECYVHDYDTKAWVRADAAWFLFTSPEAVVTPMASGILAFGDRAAADRAREKHGGEVLGYAGLTAARKAWMEERYGKPAGGG